MDGPDPIPWNKFEIWHFYFHKPIKIKNFFTSLLTLATTIVLARPALIFSAISIGVVRHDLPSNIFPSGSFIDIGSEIYKKKSKK